MPPILNIDDVLPGDVLLCRSDYEGADIAEATGSKYAHAAICIRKGWAAEASGHRVKEIEIENLLTTYDHIAVLRQPDCWSSQRIENLQIFIAAAIARKARFNCDGIRNFEEQQKLHDKNLNEKLHDFFDGKNSSPEADRDSYFCSELVAAAHVAVGVIEPSAAVVYDPSVLAPGDFGKDFIFGIFCGYLFPYPEYVIPREDEFLLTPHLNEIFEPKT